MAWPLVAAAAITAVSSYLGRKDEKKGAQRANNMTEYARQQAMQATSMPSIRGIERNVAPGLLPKESVFAGGGTAGWSAERARPGMSPALRAEGGPTKEGQVTIVGEEGPEVIVPEEDGYVIPNHEAFPPGSPMSGMQGPEMQAPGLEEPIDPRVAEVATALIPVILSILQEVLSREGEGEMALEGGMPGEEMGGEELVPGLPHRQTGGSVKQGQPTVVGEGGPEAVTKASRGNWRTPYEQGTLWRHKSQATPELGESVMGNIRELSARPGQLSPVAYQRSQEETERGRQSAQKAIQTQMAGVGVDPSSPLAQSLQAVTSNYANKQRSEAVRDYALAQEAAYRQDIADSTNRYITLLQSIFGLAGQQASAASGTGFTPVQYQSPLSAVATGVGTYAALRGNQQQKTEKAEE